MKPHLALLFSSLLLLGACAAPRPTGRRSDPPSADRWVHRTLTSFRGSRWIRGEIDRSYAYAVFPGIAKGGAGFGGAVGGGKVYEQGKLVGTAAITQITFGLQLGGQLHSGIVLFRDRHALRAFQNGDSSITGCASATFVLWGLSVDVILADGVTVITQGPVGLMYEASFGGMIFKYRSM